MYTGFWWGNLKEREHLEDPSVRWEDNIKMDLRKVGCGGKDWIDLGQKKGRRRALVNTVMNLRVPQNAGNFLTISKPVTFSRRTLLH